jgi:hypothetical protein
MERAATVYGFGDEALPENIVHDLQFFSVPGEALVLKHGPNGVQRCHR